MRPTRSNFFRSASLHPSCCRQRARRCFRMEYSGFSGSWAAWKKEAWSLLGELYDWHGPFSGQSSILPCSMR